MPCRQKKAAVRAIKSTHQSRHWTGKMSNYDTQQQLRPHPPPPRRAGFTARFPSGRHSQKVASNDRALQGRCVSHSNDSRVKSEAGVVPGWTWRVGRGTARAPSGTRPGHVPGPGGMIRGKKRAPLFCCTLSTNHAMKAAPTRRSTRVVLIGCHERENKSPAAGGECSHPRDACFCQHHRRVPAGQVYVA